ncbi:LuxR C-terminal-related transcriptional regulator [Methylomonas sp. SURF-1]|uniref:LuxR C-terminal-related transcriptional regulator n=1 Tax=Methylomonas aurea TaxID=2952224 RepID=A0ABT1UI65_9GAMM|nr:LuxR C-terminal-related transcriptional regulator [Methylomonas sp. SURF-1]MCQ8181934.1 LuxR C-terminal-related transcriptional regulator [Methylomonas sp. SURF-1]
MSIETEYDKLVGLIYEAALEPERWQAVLLGFSDWFGAAGTTLWVHDFASRGVHTELGGESFRFVRFDPAYLASYADYYTLTNVWTENEALLREGAVVTSSMLYDDNRLPETEYFGDWLRPQNLFYSLGGIVAKNGTLAVKLAALRAKYKGPYTNEDLSWYARLLPHLKRACELNQRLAGERLAFENQQTVNGTAQAVSGLCILGLSANGRLIYVNQRGESWLREGNCLTLHHGGLHALDADKDAVLQAALRNAVSSRKPQHLNLGAGNGYAHCCLTVIPAPSLGNPLLHEQQVALIVLIAANAQQRVATARQLIELFGLTAAEARFARALAQGEDVDTYANAEGLKKSTVRSHLKTAMEKTGTNSQRDLLRLVLSVPAIRDKANM